MKRFSYLFISAGILSFAALPLAFPGCATDTADAKANARGRATNAALEEAGKVLGKIAVASLMNVAQQEMGGGKANFGSAASSALWSNAGTIISSDMVAHIVDAYSGKKLPDTAYMASQAFYGSPAAPEKKAAAIAAVISSAAGAPPASH